MRLAYEEEQFHGQFKEPRSGAVQKCKIDHIIEWYCQRHPHQRDECCRMRRGAMTQKMLARCKRKTTMSSQEDTLKVLEVQWGQVVEQPKRSSDFKLRL